MASFRVGPKHTLLAAAAVILLLGSIQAALVLSAPPMEPLRIEPVAPDASRAAIDEHWETARAFAPWILHETSFGLGRQDIPVAMDFDGDLVGVNDWENLARFELLPTVHYTYAETETHIFLTYHLFHPRDWTLVPLGLQDTHEGDGENIQVVVSKTTMEPLILTTQAHYRASSYATQPGTVASGAVTLRSDFEIVVGHPAVYVERGGHGIYGSHDLRAANRLARIGAPVVTYRPIEAGETLREPTSPWNETAPYRLVSLAALLGNSTDHPEKFAGVETEGWPQPTPRYHKGDRYSGPLGPNRGISPFALGYTWEDDEFASLFWDPAARYQEALRIQGEWSRTYVVRPFGSS